MLLADDTCQRDCEILQASLDFHEPGEGLCRFSGVDALDLCWDAGGPEYLNYGCQVGIRALRFEDHFYAVGHVSTIPAACSPDRAAPATARAPQGTPERTAKGT